MGALKCFVIALALVAGSPSRAAARAEWSRFVAEASARFGVPAAWIWRVMAIESGGRTTLGGRPIRSPKGAMGLMQLMPDTWRAMRDANGLGSDPDDPRDNILAGTAYLKLMYNRFGYPGLFAAYNAGPGRYAAYLGGGGRLPRETRDYLAQAAEGAVADTRPAARRAASSAPPQNVFAITRTTPDNTSPGAATDAASATDPLVVIRRN